ncbi:hypothetical protein BHE74_00043184 [Ensete ventricosum]|nr:hypothetical protein BHE74_00043184 [Ensete ventricosum]
MESQAATICAWRPPKPVCEPCMPLILSSLCYAAVPSFCLVANAPRLRKLVVVVALVPRPSKDARCQMPAICNLLGELI